MLNISQTALLLCATVVLALVGGRLLAGVVIARSWTKRLLSASGVVGTMVAYAALARAIV